MPKNIKGLREATEARRAKLAFGGRGAYSIESLESGQFSMSEIRKEYSRLRDIARKRFQRLESSEWATGEGTVPYNFRMENYPTLREIRDEKELAIKLRDLAAVVESPRSRIYGLESIAEQSVTTMQEEGYDWVTRENWQEFSEFMAYVNTMVKNRQFDSERIVEIFAETKLTKKGTRNKNELKKAFKAYRQELEKKVSSIPEVKR